MTITVYGVPGPQGSKAFKGMHGGHAVLVESSKKVKPWREAVKWAAREIMINDPASSLSGPLRVSMMFTLPKPKSAPKLRRTWPCTRPDLSKLVRGTEDALTDSGIWKDDGNVVECFAAKRYPREGNDALESPGVIIRIWSLT